MSSLALTLGRIALLPWLVGANALLALGYIALIAVVMSYAALHVEFAEQVRSDEAAVASLEAAYLEKLSTLTETDYQAGGYGKPVVKTFVSAPPATALNTR